MGKDKVVAILEKEKNRTIRLGKNLFKNPELGYKEIKTKEIIREYIKDIKLSNYQEFAITGIKATIGNGDGIHLGLICDMDGVPTHNHKYASKKDSAAHSCGHNAQMAIMLSVFKAFYESGELEKINGTISLLAVPAEEFTDFDFRLDLIKQGKLQAFSGKQNLVLEGMLEDIDGVLACHGNGLAGHKIETDVSNNGFIAKTIVFKGKAAHAGANPHLGRNALNAAVLSMNAIGLLRETFEDDHHVRIHPIIKNGGTTVNTVPDEVVVETYVRANNIETILNVDKKVDNACKHCAMALSCSCEVKNIPGYLPSNYFTALAEYTSKSSKEFIEKEDVLVGGKTFASDDLSDVSCFKPVTQIGFSGFTGGFHSDDFDVVDEEMAYIIPAKILAISAYEIICDVDRTRGIISLFKPKFANTEEYKEKWLNR